MITTLNQACIYVLDQYSAYDFYINKLGFRLHSHLPMGAGQWALSVTPPGQPAMELMLQTIEEGMSFSRETAGQMRNLVRTGTFGPAVFTCKDLEDTYEQLKNNGVEFVKPPTLESHAYEATFKDDSGNWFSLTAKK